VLFLLLLFFIIFCQTTNFSQVISGKLYAGSKVDVWRCGVLLYALLCGRLPFDDENIPKLYINIKVNFYYFIILL
jgi:serine/threonine protein kinase